MIPTICPSFLMVWKAIGWSSFFFPSFLPYLLPLQTFNLGRESLFGFCGRRRVFVPNIFEADTFVASVGEGLLPQTSFLSVGLCLCPSVCLLALSVWVFVSFDLLSPFLAEALIVLSSWYSLLPLGPVH